jgi:hypothetical protein
MTGEAEKGSRAVVVSSRGSGVKEFIPRRKPWKGM